MKMKRRSFLQLASAAAVVSPWQRGVAETATIDLSDCAVVVAPHATPREKTAATVLLEEVEKRCGLRWPRSEGGNPHAAVRIFLGLQNATVGLPGHALGNKDHLRAEGFLIRTGTDDAGRWIAVIGADERGLLFGAGQLLRLMEFDRQKAWAEPSRLDMRSEPHYPLRGHQLGYRPKTNSYDAWTVPMWDQYIRELALFGTNAIELVPPRSDDAKDSPLFPLPPERMMVEMSTIADRYGLDVWIWYPALDKDYSKPATVEFALAEWGKIFAMLPRVDAILVPGGDPGSTPPALLFALIEKQKANLRKYHPKGQMWVSPQGFNAAYTEEFYNLVRQEHTQTWLDGIAFGPMSRLSIQEMRRTIPEHYPLRCYQDMTHSVWCQYPVVSWDLAYALTEGREVINPRPLAMQEIAKNILPYSIGFITYSEGCNDEVNKFVWSALGWSPDRPIFAIIRDFAHCFTERKIAEGFAHGLMNLERNWHGPLASNSSVEITLSRFQDMEAACSGATLGNWRFQQALFRAYFDAYIRRRLLNEQAYLTAATDVLNQILELGWSPVTMGASPPAKDTITNGLDPDILLAQAVALVEQPMIHPAGAVLRRRLGELGEALFQSIRMQLAVDRYKGEAVRRGANLDTADHPVTDILWMRRQLLELRKSTDAKTISAGIRSILYRTDPGPGGFYDELGNPANRPHFLDPQHDPNDPDNRHIPVIDSLYPDTLHDAAPMAWKHWVQSIYDAPVRLHYQDLDPSAEYFLRIVYGGDEPKEKIRLVANEDVEIHPALARTWPPAPQEFPVPKTATARGRLLLTWTAEPGRGNDGRGCQIAEVFLIPKTSA